MDRTELERKPGQTLSAHAGQNCFLVAAVTMICASAEQVGQMVFKKYSCMILAAFQLV
jgi:hypothetical protein